MHVPTYPAWEIEKKASEFHATYCGNPIRIPVNIELIIEKQLGSGGILPIRNLRRDYETYGCLVYDQRDARMMIVVDEYMADNNVTTYRFTLAEEVAHHLLHNKIFKHATSVSKWSSTWSTMSPTLHWQLDRNAKYLAGALLIPKDSLNSRVREVYDQYFADLEVLNEKHLRALIAQKLAPEYEVSADGTMFCRLKEHAITEMKHVFAEHRFFLEPEQD